MDRQLLLAKPEVDYGVDPVAVAANAVMCEGVTFKLTGQRVKPNPAKPGVGPVASHTFGEYVEMSYEIPLAGSGDPGVAPKWGPILKACGWSETIVADTSVTYALMANPTAAPSAALVWRDDRRLHKVLGFRARAGLKLTAGQRPMLVITGKGLHVPLTTGAALAHADAVWTGWFDAKPVAYGTTTFEFDSETGLGLRELSFDQSDNVKFINVPEQLAVNLLGERAFTGNLKFTTPLPSDLSLEAKWVAGDVVVWSMGHDNGASGLVTINGRTQIVDPTYARDDEWDTTAAGLELVPSSLSTDDDLSIVLT